MKMTLFTDASHCNRTGAAGWGSWAIRDGWPRGRFMGGELQLKEHAVQSSNTAELAAIGHALWTLYRQGDLEGVQAIMIQSDNVHALAMILQHVPRVRVVKSGRAVIGRTSSGHPSVKAIMETIRTTLEGIAVSVKHVKAHTENDDGRSWVNDQCDREAKRHMVTLRRRLDLERKEVAS